MDRIGEVFKKLGYEPPIRIIYDGIDKQKEQIENDVYSFVRKYVIYVEKDELIKALKYDRQQYEAGFADGRKSVKIETAEEIDRLISRLEEMKNEL